MNANKNRENLREWIAQRNKISLSSISDETNLIEEGIISSLDTLELIFFIESIGGEVVNLRAGVFKNLNVILETFFGDQGEI